ncbi:MAG: hypothetical protein R2793_05440 [Flavobacteriaceae bacterium]
MPKIIIHRIPEMENRFRAIHLEVDGKRVAKITHGEKQVIEVPVGKHSLQAKIDWGKSNLVELDLGEQDELEYELKKGKGSVLYRAFLGYEHYLSLELKSPSM